MKFTEEQLAKIKAAKTAEELIAIAKAEGIEATEEQIKALFAFMHNEGELADDELENVSGAGCDGLAPRTYRAKYNGKWGYARECCENGPGAFSSNYYFTSDDGTYQNKCVFVTSLEFA